MGSMGVQTALKVLQGQTVPKNIDTGSLLITKANAAQLLHEPASSY
jgi:ABC-type sugar transport system substrate-binding protein